MHGNDFTALSAYDDRTLSETLADAVRQVPSAAIVIHSEQRPARTTLAQIVDQGRFLARRLADRGIGPGDTVAVQLPGWAEWLVAAVAVAHVGAILLPIVSIYGWGELDFIVRESRARLIITPDRWRGAVHADVLAACAEDVAGTPHLIVGAASGAAMAWDDLVTPCDVRPAAARRSEDQAMLIYTSGSSGRPKGVRHTHGGLLAELATVAWSQRDVAEPVVLSPWPPGHIAGALTMLRFLVSGVPLVSMDRWAAAAATELIERERVTCMSCLPLHLAAILDVAEHEHRDISSLRHCPVGAAPVPAALIDRCEAMGLAVYHAYGSTEHPTISLGSPGDPLDKRLSTEGRLCPGVELRIVDDHRCDAPPGMSGEIAVRGPEQFAGYLDPALDGAAHLDGGWFLTGDLGRLDDDGFLVIVDRKKDIVIRGGENISSREVEELLMDVPGISAAAVIGAPHAVLGEIVSACVEISGGSVTIEDIARYFARRGVAVQKVPEALTIYRQLPRNAVGKIDKVALKTAVRSE